MITRRALIFTGTTGFAFLVARSVAKAATPSAGDPVAFINTIYARAMKAKGGGAFVIEDRTAKEKYLSKSLFELWTKTDANTPKGEVGPIDFDPVSNAQDADIKSFKVAAEKIETDKAVILATISGRMPRAKSSDNLIRYNLVREDKTWKIDDISGTIDGEPWSVRDILNDSLKELA
jgi:hypothetical protein